jgi:hypothetical protein
MTLIQDPANPARWTDDGWTPGTPGTFAVVIGASSYRHLKQGDAQVAQTYDLGQLHVCALTAHRFFRWLRDGYRNPGAPLAQVWLLLAPSKEERALTEAQAPGDAEFVRQLQAGVVEPTVAACERAIREWFYEMQKLPRPDAEASRAFFLFTGHGLEVTQEEQILLPCDYLQPPSIPEDAIAVRNLRDGLSAIPVRDQFFFLDACRNDHQALRALRLTGRPILSQPGSAQTYPERNLSILYGSAAGTQAWSPRDPAEGPSLFGQALLEGLQAVPGVEVECAGDPPTCVILTYDLHKFVKNRVKALLEARGAAVRQYVPLGGSRIDDPPVTQVPRPHPQAPGPAGPTGLEPTDGRFPTRGEGPSFFEVKLNTRMGWRLDAPPPPDATVASGSLYEMIRSEQVTAALDSLQIWALAERRWLEKSEYTLHRIERDAGGQVFRVDIRIPRIRGQVWMQLDAFDMRLACVLAPDVGAAPEYRILLYRDAEAHRVTGMEVRLAPEQQNPLLGQAARLWDEYRAGNVREVAHSTQMLEQLGLLLYSKGMSPLAATVAGLILLRAGELERMHHWPRNLANWFDDRSDGAVIWAELRLRTGAGDTAAVEEAARYARMAAERGLPATSEAVGYLSTHLRGNGMKAEAEWLARRLAYFQSGGLFTVLMGPKDEVTHELAYGLNQQPTG